MDRLMERITKKEKKIKQAKKMRLSIRGTEFKHGWERSEARPWIEAKLSIQNKRAIPPNSLGSIPQYFF